MITRLGTVLFVLHHGNQSTRTKLPSQKMNQPLSLKKASKIKAQTISSLAEVSSEMGWNISIFLPNHTWGYWKVMIAPAFEMVNLEQVTSYHW